MVINLEDLSMFEGQRILVSGGSGSWGNELTKQLLEKSPKKIIIFSRGELAQVNMQRKFNDPRLEFVIGDVRDYPAVERVFDRGVDYVFHLAALKHVPVCENQPQEAIKTNIDGTTNLVNAAIKYKIKKFIDVSTDKSVSPTNLYGFTKAVGEKIVIQANNLTKDTDFVCIRAGNVLGSNGSVVPLFIDQIARYNKITVTCGKMTRYFMTLPEAITLLFKATEHSVGGETFVMHMPAFYIQTLAEVIVRHYGDLHTQIEEIGIREGEKIDELLISEYEATRSVIYDDDYYVIKSDLKINRDYSHLSDKPKVPFDSYSSSYEIKDREYLHELLSKGGFLR